MKKKKSHIGKEDYVTAVNKADRESSLGNGWVAKDRPHKNKKKYDRNRDKKFFPEPESLV